MASLSSIRQRARALAGEYRGRPTDLARFALGQALGNDAQLAFELYRACPAATLELSPDQIERLLGMLHDWNSTDCFGCFVSGVAWREGRLRDADIARWARSGERWTRRAALVSTVPLNLPARGATAPGGEARRTLVICSRLIDDRDDMVVKALSWALRVLAGKDKKAVATFVAENRGRLAARVVRETTNKLSTGLKNPRRILRQP